MAQTYGSEKSGKFFDTWNYVDNIPDYVADPIYKALNKQYFLDNFTTADAMWDLMKTNSDIKQYLNDDWIAKTESVFDELAKFKANLNEYIVEEK